MTIYNINWCVTWGAMAATAGALLAAGWPTLFELYRRHLLVLTNGSMSFDIWRELPIPVYSEFYLYNITNVDDILAGKDVKLRVQQMGPYVFRESQKKVNIKWNVNSTVSYQTQRTWHYQPDRSTGSLSDVVTNINILIPSMAYILRYDNTMVQMVTNMVAELYFPSIFLSANVSSWLFDGIECNLLNIFSTMPHLSNYIPFDKIGWLYKRNGSAEYEGWFVVNTGAEDFSRFGKMELWNHFNQTMYPGSCGEVRGSTGELWAPRKSQPEILFFSSDLRTSMALSASGPVTIHGVEGTMFVSNDSLFDNGQKYPIKACYCTDTPDDCMPSGVMNVSLRAFGMPLFVTQPHFHYVDSYYADKIEGMEPTEDYDFEMTIEMVTGIPLMLRGQLQVNILVRHNSWMSLNNQLPEPDVLVPMVWVREQATVDDYYSSFLRLVLKVYYITPYVFYIIITMGVTLLSIGLWFVRCRSVKKHADIIESEMFLNRESN